MASLPFASCSFALLSAQEIGDNAQVARESQMPDFKSCCSRFFKFERGSGFHKYILSMTSFWTRRRESV
jgi:hypothetical protein